MRPALSQWLPRASIAIAVVAGALVAWRAGGGADARGAPPRPEGTAATVAIAVPDPARGAEAYEVRTRLVDALGTARIEVPGLAAATPAFQSYWRKLRGPWATPSGVAGQLVTTLSLLTSAQETQWSVLTHTGAAWAPKARVWNMNEGSFDQREAIFAPTPATLTFHLAVPPDARLRVAPAIAAPFSAATTFDVAVVDAAGVAHVLSEVRVAAGDTPDAHRWHDLDLDLAPWGGQSVDLRLETSTERAGETERRRTPQGADAGAAPEGPSASSPASLALWGDPLLVSKEATRLPYDVLWIVVDALRPDVVAALHDPVEDRAKLAAPRPPLEALLPVVPGLMPAIDALAARGVHFQHAWSSAAWTRPGTLAMLSGERSTELGLDTTAWVVPPEEAVRFYASNPPLLPLVLRKSGAVTAAIVNNFFMSGHAAVGVDMGFERLTDHRYRTRDTGEITQDALEWLTAHAEDRFFLFVNYNSPHEPYDPLREMLARIPRPPSGPRDPTVRSYMAEAAKDDDAIGTLLGKLDALGLTRSTLVVVTADHGETLSEAHTGFGLGHMPIRFHHAVGMFEETTRIPIILALPGVLDGGGTVIDRVRNIDLAPTVLELEGLEADPRMSGRSMMPLVRHPGEHVEARVVLSEGRAARALLWENWRLVIHEPVAGDAHGPKAVRATVATAVSMATSPPDADAKQARALEDELFDLNEDPGERRNVARLHPDILASMKARLAAAAANVPAADAVEASPPAAVPTIRLRFAGGGQARRVSGTLTVGDGTHAAVVVVDPAGIDREAVHSGTTGAPGARQTIDFALTTSPDAPVGLDVRVDPPGAPVGWQFFLDDAPWPDGMTFAGPFGLPASACRSGIATDEARGEAYSADTALIDPARDLGVFVTRDRAEDARPSGPGAPGEAPSTEVGRETERVLEEWGYAHRKETKETRNRKDIGTPSSR